MITSKPFRYCFPAAVFFLCACGAQDSVTTINKIEGSTHKNGTSERSEADEPIFNLDAKGNILDSKGPFNMIDSVMPKDGVIVQGGAIMFRSLRDKECEKSSPWPCFRTQPMKGPYPLYRAILQSAEKKGGSRFETLSRRDGSFAIGPVRPGYYHLIIEPEEGGGMLTSITYNQSYNHLSPLIRLDRQRVGQVIDVGDTVEITWNCGTEKNFRRIPGTDSYEIVWPPKYTECDEI